jgi:hypothetical protein
VLRVEAPANMTVLSTAARAHTAPSAAPGHNMTEFAPTPVMAPDSLAFAAGNLRARRRPTAAGLNVTAYTVPGPAAGQVNFALRVRLPLHDAHAATSPLRAPCVCTGARRRPA